MFLAAGIKTMILQELQLRPKILQQQRIMSPIMHKWIPDCDVIFDFNGGASTNYVISIPNGVKHEGNIWIGTDGESLSIIRCLILSQLSIRQVIKELSLKTS